MARPEPPISLQDQKISASRFQFSFNGNAGRTYPVSVSPDLIGWTLLTNISTTTAGSVIIEDQPASTSPRRFYRIGPAPSPITNMVYIPPGTFTMGSPPSERDRETKESPQTEVTISHGFWVGKYEVTQEECVALTGTNHAVFVLHPWMPVDFTSWVVATNYCQTLTEKETVAGRLPPGYCYRLPTEAEWEYACRAGTKTPVAIGEGTSLSSFQANFDGNFPYGGAPIGLYLQRPDIVGKYPPNAWGLYDIHGNVAEWCLDFYGPYPGGAVTDPKGPTTGTARVLRGGAYNSIGNNCRSARRDSRSPTLRNFGAGFRVVLAADP
jgi:formylglycine-generating enzyme required for sulfatase activity